MRRPVAFLLPLVGTIAALACFTTVWYRHAPSVQQVDFVAYVRTNAPAIPFWTKYTFAVNGSRFATTDDPVIRKVTQAYNHEALQTALQDSAYEGHSLAYVLKWPLMGALLVMVGLSTLTRRMSQQRDRVLRGPRVIGLAAWNAAIKRWNRGPFLRLKWWRKLYLPQDALNQHIVIQGGTGTGKSVIARSLAYQFMQRGPVIFLDVKREYVEEFASPEDWILDPGDARCPVWALEEESLDELRATAPATSAFPDEPRANPYFRKHPRFIIAHILAEHHPSTKELALMLAGPNEIAKLLRGTELSHTMTGSGEAQSSMLATLAELGRSLKFWPSKDEGHNRRVFSAVRWAKERKGNIFLTSSPDTLDGLKPSQSMLLDMLILGMQKYPGPGAMILDEFAQMGRLPKLESAISLQRTAGNPIVLVFQEVSQIENTYGILWRAIVSQPAIQFVFRTKEGQSATHSSDVLGKQEVERIRESTSRSWFQRDRKTESNERPILPAVLPGEIQSLKNLSGYVSIEGNITKFGLQYLPRTLRADRLIERIIPTQKAILPQPTDIKSRYAKPLELSESGNS